MKQVKSFISTARRISFLSVIILTFFAAAAIRAQITPQEKNVSASPEGVPVQPTAFTYQGRLTDSMMTGNGAFDFQFALFSQSLGGTAIGTQTVPNVPVTNGIFTVRLDFGADAFPDEERFLEIRVKRQSETNYTTLTPRQQITNAPFAIRSKTATTAENSNNTLAVGGTSAANIIKEGDARLTDSRPPTAGSTNYVQNSTTQQTGTTNFNISGNGTLGGTLSANAVNSMTSFNIGGQTLLRTAATSNTFLGFNTAGQGNLTGSFNSFFGFNSGLINSSGSENVFVGVNAGNATTSGSNNSFFGTAAGFTNRTGSNNTLIGYNANVSGLALSYATALGAGATVSDNNSIVLGRAADTVRIPGNLNLAGNFTGSFTIPAANITGTFSAGQIPNLDAAKITTGTFSAAQIPNLDAAKITSGTFSTAQIPNLSASYIRNQTSAQTNSNFNISGNGTAGGTLSANIVNSTGGFNISGNRVLGANSPDNIWVGVGAGNTTMTGLGNVFVGAQAGFSNTTGGENSFIGKYAGRSNTEGFGNVFVGASAGQLNTTGGANSFVGTQAGVSNTQGNFNSFFGAQTGYRNTTGGYNSFFGAGAGLFSSTGNSNSFFGANAGFNNDTGEENSFLGANSGANNSTGNLNSFVGAYTGNANTTGNSNSFFGANTGVKNTTGGFNSFVGVNAGGSTTSGGFNSFFGEEAGGGNTTGTENSFIGSNAGKANKTGSYNTIIGTDADVGSGGLSFATALGAGAVVSENNTVVLGRATDKVFAPGALVIGLYGTGGNTQLCVDTSNNRVSTCGSSLRYKTNIQPFNFGLNLIKQLRPVTFDWKSSGQQDLGLVAEEVAAVEPLLAGYDKNGQVEGVKYDRVGVVLVNAVREQQIEIEVVKADNQSLRQQLKVQTEMLERQQTIIEAMKKMLCEQNPSAAVCREEK